MPRSIFVIVISSLIILSFLSSGFHTNAASGSDFSSANNSINSAFSSIFAAQKDGGNVTSLIAKLNTAVALLSKAQSENATNPPQATSDLQNATQIAQQVTSEAPPVASAGRSAVQFNEAVSISSAAGIIIIAALIYIYGGRIYHRTWFYLYKKYLVRAKNG
ncbi:MAG TPA: hypothetical protein VJN71_05225 [Nitrososphaerales archaeon]|nr:hypothetical protein [Nitrososphaerales archaeon]